MYGKEESENITKILKECSQQLGTIQRHVESYKWLIKVTFITAVKSFSKKAVELVCQSIQHQLICFYAAQLISTNPDSD